MTTLSQSTSESGSSPRTSRRYARQLGLQMLFQHEFQPADEAWQEKFWKTQTVSSEVKAFALQLYQGVLEHQTDIDALIRKFAVDWAIERMPVVDRNILRVAIFELLWEPKIPAMVTINEAIELAKRFADEEAKRFVNGLLDHILRDDQRLADKRTSESVPPVS